MRLLISDLYIMWWFNKDANILYNIAINKKLNKDDILYITSMNKSNEK